MNSVEFNVVIKIKKWLLQTIEAGFILGLIVAVNVEVNPLITYEHVKFAVALGMMFWAIIGVIVWASHHDRRSKRAQRTCF